MRNFVEFSVLTVCAKNFAEKFALSRTSRTPLRYQPFSNFDGVNLMLTVMWAVLRGRSLVTYSGANFPYVSHGRPFAGLLKDVALG